MEAVQLPVQVLIESPSICKGENGNVGTLWTISKQIIDIIQGG